MSLDVPYQLGDVSMLVSQRHGANQKPAILPVSPAETRLLLKGFPAAKAARHSSVKRSSGWNAFIQPHPSPSSKEDPYTPENFG